MKIVSLLGFGIKQFFNIRVQITWFKENVRVQYTLWIKVEDEEKI